MKKNIFKMMLVFSLLSLGGFTAKAQIVVIRPRHEVVEIRPERPSVRHIWRDGEWEWRNGAYVWVPGVWIVPEGHRAWRPGHWKRVRGGYVWRPGHWVR